MLPTAVIPADDASGVVADLVLASVTDSIMADLAPLKFRGVVSENAEAWIRQFNNYCEYRDYNAEKAKQLFKVSLIDSAVVWFDSLPATVRHDWTQLQAALRIQYMPAEFLKYQHAGEFFSCKQNDMAVQDYCAHMQQLARHVGADDTVLRFAILNGLRSDINSHVTRAQPTTLKDLQDAATTAELCPTEKAPCEDSLAIQLNLMQHQLKQVLTNQNTGAAKSSASVNRSNDRRTRSPSPRRVHFDDERQQSPNDNRRSRYDDY